MSALSRRVANLECRRPPARPPPSPEDEIARVRAMLIAAFGEEDFAAALALDEADATAAEAEKDRGAMFPHRRTPVGLARTNGMLL